MPFFGKSKQSKRQALTQRAEQLAGTVQLEFYASCKQALLARMPDELAATVAAALANFVFRFGHVNPEHESNSDLMRLVHAEKERMLASFGETFKTNATGVLILLGAAWEVDLAKFRAHLKDLVAQRFATLGAGLPGAPG